MNAQNVLIGAAVVFVLMRAVCEPKLAPGREIWHRIIEPRPVDVAVLAGVRFVGTASLLIGLGAAIGMCLTWWVESLNPVAMGKVANQEAIDRIRGLLTVFAIAQSALSPLGKLLSVVYVVVFAVGSIFWWSRRDVRRELKVAIEELEALAHKNKLPHEPPDERMRHVDRAIAAAHAANAGIGVIEDLYERRFQYDLARRLSPELLRDTGEPLSGARVPAILRFLISPLLWHPMKRLGRIVSTFLMIVMVPAALTIVASGDLNRAIDEKRQVLVALKGALTLEIELRPKMPPPTPPPDQDGEEEDAVAAAAFGRAFEVAWGTSLLGRSATQPEAARIDDARRSWARRQVLLESAARRDAVVVAEATSNMSPRQVLSQAVMDAALKARTGSEPATSIGELAEKTGRLARIGTKSVATAYPSWTIHDVFATATTAGFGWAVDGAIDTESTEITRLVDVVKQTLEQAAEPLIPLSRSIKLAILSQASLVRGEATANPKPSLELFITPDSVRSLKVALENVTDLDFPRRDASLSLEVVSNKDIDRAKVETALRPYVRNGRPRLDSLASYSSLFPGIGGQRAQTEQASIARALSPAWASVQYGAPPERSAREGRPLRVLKPAEVTPSAKHHLDLARSFGRLHTHHKVGGVLIGREPNNATTSLDFVDIDLSIEGRGKDEKKGLVIHLMRADGNRIVVGPYDPAVAQLALAYAADGRPVTVTILPARPLRDRKILLHPILVDTETGCHAIRLDQFVDRFGQEVLERNRTVIGLYGVAWGARYVERASLEQTHAVDAFIHATRLMSQRVAIQSMVSDIAPIDPVVLEPLRGRPHFFDSELVEILDRCLNEGNGRTATQCVEKSARQAGAASRDLLLGQAGTQADTISGVRETAYALDENLNFAQMPRDIWSGPLRFTALNIVKSEMWEMPEVTTKALEGAVLSAVRVKTDVLRSLHVMQQFTVAQRLFRAALGGGLGKQFPVERLVEVVRETTPYVHFGAVKTDRWLLRHEPRDEPAIRLREALRVPEVHEATCLGLPEH